MELLVDPLRFDIEIIRTCPRAPLFGSALFGAQLGFAGAELTLPDARLVAAALRAAGGAGMIVPCAYRAPVISLEAAREIAEQRLQLLRAQQGGWFGPLEGGETQSLWWRFHVDHRAIVADDAEPERVCIDVDRIDGHVATLMDEWQFAQWQQDVSWCRPAGPDDGPASRPASSFARSLAR